jgi:phosphohistidine swiveling domain-containing protein
MLKNLLRKLKSQQWRKEESLASLHSMSHWSVCYVYSYLSYGQPLWTMTFYYFLKPGYVYEESSVNETKKALDWVLKKALSRPYYFEKKYREFAQIIDKIDKLFLEVLAGINAYSNQKLLNLFSRIVNLGRQQYGYSAIAETSDILEEKDFLKMLPNIPREETVRIIQTLSTPPFLTIADREHLSLYKLGLFFLKNKKSPSFYKVLDKCVEQFFWVQNNFASAKYLTREYFLTEMKNLISKKNVSAISREIKELINKPKNLKLQQNKIIKKYKLPKNTQVFFSLIQLFAKMHDQRKECVQKLIFCIDQVLRQISQRFNIDRETLDYYTVEEIIGLLKKGQKVSEAIVRKRTKSVVFFSYFKNKKINTEILYGKKALKIIEYFEQKKKEAKKTKVLFGLVGSIGKNPKFTGRVKIVFDPWEAKDFRDGEILVTGMTRPEFIPLMRRAGAVITNEGGITCHAAIVSRELGIPCIVGTKIATEVLRNRDLVEVDANKGIVKILKRHQNF